MKKTVQQLREARGESLQQLASALRVSVSDLRGIEDGSCRPSVERVHQITRHFGIDETEIDLDPDRPSSVGEQIADTLFE